MVVTGKRLIWGLFMACLFPALVAAAPTSQPSVQKGASFVLSGQAVNVDGDALSNARVRAWPMMQPDQAISVNTDGEGRFRLRITKNGAYQMQVTAPAYRPKRISFLVNQAQSAQVCIHMREWSSGGDHSTPSLTAIDVHWQPNRVGAFDSLMRVFKRLRWLQQHMKKNHPQGDTAAIHKKDWKQLASRINGIHRSMGAAHPLLHRWEQLLRKAIAYSSQEPKSKARQSTRLALAKDLRTLPLRHLLWSLSASSTIDWLALAYPQHFWRKVEELARTHPNAGLRLKLLGLRLSHLEQSIGSQKQRHIIKVKMRALAKQLQGLSPQVTKKRIKPLLQRIKWYTSAPTKTLPPFSVGLFGSTQKRFTNNHLKGKITLICVWATWCDVCVDKMPALHQIHRKYSRYGFQVLSVSYDTKRATIDAFRRDKWPMPWLHSHAKNAFSSHIGKLLKVRLLPTQVLFGPNGEIIADDQALTGARFLPTLETHLSRAYQGRSVLKRVAQIRREAGKK